MDWVKRKEAGYRSKHSQPVQGRIAFTFFTTSTRWAYIGGKKHQKKEHRPHSLESHAYTFRTGWAGVEWKWR